jgi:hypothetical protein
MSLGELAIAINIGLLALAVRQSAGEIVAAIASVKDQVK